MNLCSVNSDYEAARNTLIPVAEREANLFLSQMGSRAIKSGLTRADVWNKTFHTAMNRLAREVGLV